MNNGLTLALIALQFLITMLFYPIRIGANGHISLARDKVDVDLKVFRLTVARVRIKREKGLFRLLINGKPVKSEGKISPKRMLNITKQYKIEGIKARGNLLAMIGTQDAKNTAMLYAGLVGILQPLVTNLKVFSASPSDTLEIDGRLKIKINIVQIANLVFAGLRG